MTMEAWLPGLIASIGVLIAAIAYAVRKLSEGYGKSIGTRADAAKTHADVAKTNAETDLIRSKSESTWRDSVEKRLARCEGERDEFMRLRDAADARSKTARAAADRSMWYARELERRARVAGLDLGEPIVPPDDPFAEPQAVPATGALAEPPTASAFGPAPVADALIAPSDRRGPGHDYRSRE